jgi:hypothetical protein
MHPGRRPSISKEAEEGLMIWLLEQQKQKPTNYNRINYDMLIRKMESFDDQFCHKSYNAKKHILRRWVERNKVCL